jgi:predicted AAA+ superfamily ATPase
MLGFELFPFSFREFLSFKNKELYNLLENKMKQANLFNFDIKKGFGAAVNKRLAEELEKYVVYGGYPAAALSVSDAEKQKILSSIIENYLLKDIKSLLRLATDDELLRLSKFLAAQIGGMIKYEELSNISGLYYKDVLKHLNILEKTFIINLIRPFFTNRRTELTKNPKNYFIDLGIRNFLLSDFRPFKTRNDQGLIMENYGYNMMRNQELFSNIKYWRTKSKAEVDFVIEKQQNLFPIEIKYISKETISKSLYSFIEKFKPKIAIVLTKDYLGKKAIKKTVIKFIPLSYF